LKQKASGDIDFAEKTYGYPILKLSDLGKKLYDYEKWNEDDEEMLDDAYSALPLTERQIQFFKRYGYLVVENAFPKELTRYAAMQTKEFLQKVGIDFSNLGNTLNSKKWSIVGHRFGAMLEFYWLDSSDKLRQHPNGYSITAQLVKATWSKNEGPWKHPYGDFDPKKLNLFIDRQNFRFPTSIVDKILKQEKAIVEKTLKVNQDKNKNNESSDDSEDQKADDEVEDEE